MSEMKHQIIYVTPEQYELVRNEPVDNQGKISPRRLSEIIGKDKMLQIMRASLGCGKVEVRPRSRSNKVVDTSPNP